MPSMCTGATHCFTPSSRAAGLELTFDMSAKKANKWFPCNIHFFQKILLGNLLDSWFPYYVKCNHAHSEAFNPTSEKLRFLQADIWILLTRHLY